MIFLETDCCENVSDGRWTERFYALSNEEKNFEVDMYWAEAVYLIQNVSDDQLVTLENYEVWDFLSWNV